MTNKFTCTSIDGGGTDHDEGIWLVTVAPKTITFCRNADDWFDSMTFRVPRIDVGTNEVRFAGFGNVVIDHEDGTYTAYPQQSGTPYYFEPITQEQNAK